MKSSKAGEIILDIEVTNISQFGFWLMIDETEYFLSFQSFPWFTDARISDISNIKRLSENHLYWENLNVDLTIDMIKTPANYPLVSK